MKDSDEPTLTQKPKMFLLHSYSARMLPVAPRVEVGPHCSPTTRKKGPPALPTHPTFKFNNSPSGEPIDELLGSDSDILTRIISLYGASHKKVTGSSTNIHHVGPDDFTAIKFLGKGAFGEVFLVKHKRTLQHFAMKVINKQKLKEQKLLEYSHTERRIMIDSHHPFIVSLQYAFQTADKLCLVLDYCPGGDLSGALKKEKRFSESRARVYLCEIILALECLHAKDIVYRDLKPQNLLVAEDGHIKLTDFGLSKEGVGQRCGATSFCGSLEYMAPEIVQKHFYGKSVDYYMLGVLLYEMLVGVSPYYSPKKEQMMFNIRKGITQFPYYLTSEAVDLIQKLIHRNPEERLGCSGKGIQDLKKHSWFKSVNWEDIYAKNSSVPKPELDKPKLSRHLSMPFYPAAELEKKSDNIRVDDWSFFRSQLNP